MPVISESLSPTWVLITGATGGAGKAFAAECASRGWNLCLTDLDPALLDLLAGGLRRLYRVEVRCYPCDLTEPASRQDLFTALQSSGLRFHLLLSLAGLEFEGPFLERTPHELRTILRLNLEGAVETTHALLRLRDPQRPFRILLMSSLAAFFPMPLKVTYAASKRFLVEFGRALGAELASQDASVTVVCPAGLPTHPASLRRIESQGWLGLLTTTDIGRLADRSLDLALRGRPLYIPGSLNCLLRSLGGLFPAAWLTRLLARRWQQATLRQSNPTTGWTGF